MRTRYVSIAVGLLVVCTYSLPSDEAPRVAADYGGTIRLNDSSPVLPGITVTETLLPQIGISFTPYIYAFPWAALGMQLGLGLGSDILFTYSLDLYARGVARFEIGPVAVEALYGWSHSGVAWGFLWYTRSGSFSSQDIGARILIGNRHVGRFGVGLIRSTPIASSSLPLHPGSFFALEIGGVREEVLTDSQLMQE